MRKLTLDWLLDGTLMQLIIEKGKNTKQKKLLIKFQKNYKYLEKYCSNPHCATKKSGTFLNFVAVNT